MLTQMLLVNRYYVLPHRTPLSKTIYVHLTFFGTLSLDVNVIISNYLCDHKCYNIDRQLIAVPVNYNEWSLCRLVVITMRS